MDMREYGKSFLGKRIVEEIVENLGWIWIVMHSQWLIEIQLDVTEIIIISYGCPHLNKR